MPIHPERRLYTPAELPSVLQLSQEQIDWLVNTGQLQTVRMCGEVRFDSRDIDRLISTYKTTQSRRIQ